MESPASTDRSSGVVTVLAAAGIVAALMQTLVVPLIGDLPQILDTTASNASWVITITLLVGSVATPVTGRLGDLLGKRRMLLFCSVPLVLGSVTCALATSLVPMIVGRGLQGLGVGMVPLGISALRELVPPQKLGSSIALMSATMGIGGALGLPIAALVIQNANWRVLFWGCAVLSVVIGILIWRLIRPRPRSRRVDGSTSSVLWVSAWDWCRCCWPSRRVPSGAGGARRSSACSRPR